MEKEPYIMAVDLGTSALKTALISISGKLIGWEVQDIPLQVLPDGGAEQIRWIGGRLSWLLPNALSRKSWYRLKASSPYAVPLKASAPFPWIPKASH